MRTRALLTVWTFLAGLTLITSTHAQTQTETPGLSAAILRAAEALPPSTRDQVRRVVQSPTLAAHPPADDFMAHPQVYQWLLDHPDRVATAWHRLGVPCAKIAATGPNQFAWTDELGSVLNWEPFYRGPDGRMWYARGQVKPSPLLPMVPVKAVAVLRCTPAEPSAHAVPLRHQADLYVLAENKLAGITSKLMAGAGAVPKIADQGTSQLLLFFGKMAQRLAVNPQEAEDLFGP